MGRIAVGAYRDDAGGPMQVVSGPMGRERVHFEAPAAERLGAEMEGFLAWFASDAGDPLLRAAIAHLWFLTLHPFDDGNGRIGRAILDLALARADGTIWRAYSMSALIARRKGEYYTLLERSQKASLEITPWLGWSLESLDEALAASDGVLATVRAKGAFWRLHAGAEINERQRRVLDRVLDGFEGKLRSGKYAALAKCSTDTALRDLTDLVARGLLVREGNSDGRSTSYDLALDPETE